MLQVKIYQIPINETNKKFKYDFISASIGCGFDINEPIAKNVPVENVAEIMGSIINHCKLYGEDVIFNS